MQLACDDFTVLSIPQSYALDAQHLHKQWKTAMANIHPDRFMQSNPSEQRIAMQWSIRINEAYQRLKNPLKRAEYLCYLRGVPLNTETNTAMPLEFLMDQIKWRECLEQSRTESDKQRIKNTLLLKVHAYEQQVHTALDIDKNTHAAVPLIKAWMFLDKLIQSIDI